MSRDPAIDGVFEPMHRWKGISRTYDAPDSTQFPPDSVHRGRARVLLTGGVNHPRFAIHIGAGEAVLFYEVRRLIREGQHPAGLIARPNPLRGARSKASGAVEEKEEFRHECWVKLTR
jgi:hypothetical protein